MYFNCGLKGIFSLWSSHLLALVKVYREKPEITKSNFVIYIGKQNLLDQEVCTSSQMIPTKK